MVRSGYRDIVTCNRVGKELELGVQKILQQVAVKYRFPYVHSVAKIVWGFIVEIVDQPVKRDVFNPTLFENSIIFWLQTVCWLSVLFLSVTVLSW